MQVVYSKAAIDKQKGPEWIRALYVWPEQSLLAQASCVFGDLGSGLLIDDFHR